VRLVVEVRRGASARVVANQLLKHTRLSGRFSANMVALVGGTPRSLGLKALLQHFLDFRVRFCGCVFGCAGFIVAYGGRGGKGMQDE
jgi:DNA gyrase/topoisomerase IV subunit A